MSRSKSFNTKYGYIRHTDDKDGVCFWCGEECGNTWDYTPSRDFAKFPDVMAKCKQTPIAVNACTTCISASVYRKRQLQTLDAKRMFFQNRRMKVEVKFREVESHVGLHSWQYRDKATGQVKEYLDEVLTEHPDILAQKNQWKEEQAKKPQTAIENPFGE